MKRENQTHMQKKKNQSIETYNFRDDEISKKKKNLNIWYEKIERFKRKHEKMGDKKKKWGINADHKK